MSLLRRLFGKKPEKSDPKSQNEDRSKYMPEIELPIDERFTINFKANGGKFLYSLDQNEVDENLTNILIENDWNHKKAMIIDQQLAEKYKSFDFETTLAAGEASFFFCTCENLIANDGSILISSNQIAEKKLMNLPDNFIIIATTSQIVESISEGMKGIKNKCRGKIPTNITTIKHFKTKEEGDFLSYGSSTKNLYLLLLEDL